MVSTAGLRWMRYGRLRHAAHLYEGRVQLCPTLHGRMAKGKTRARLQPADLTQHGVPFGRVCERCLRIWERRPR